MSGDRIHLPGPALDRLGSALVQLVGLDARFRLVGGLAVMLRLTDNHRATSDLDTVASAPEMLAAVAPSNRIDATHLWAHRSWTAIQTRVGTHEATVKVATSDALLGGKLAARLSTSRDPRKHASDASDIVGLLRLLPPDDSLPDPVRHILAEGLDRAVISRAELLTRDANRLDPEGRTITEEEVADLAQDWIDALGQDPTGQGDP